MYQVNLAARAEKIMLNIITAVITSAVIATDLLPYAKLRLFIMLFGFKFVFLLGVENSFLPED